MDYLTNEELILLRIVYLNGYLNSDINWNKVIERGTFKEEQLVKLAKLKLIEIEDDKIRATELGRIYQANETKGY